MSEITSPPVRYTGSKWRIAPWVIGKFPPHNLYCEPFCGGASVLFRKSKSKIEVINDLNQEVTNFFDVLRERTEDLQRALFLTPYSRYELQRAHEESSDTLERARRFYIRSWQKFSGGSQGHEGSWRYEKSQADCYPLKNWKQQCDSLFAFAERLRDVYIESDTAVNVIERFDSPQTLFYCDPPYVAETRTEENYAHEMSESDHRALAQVLISAKGKVLISGYDSPLYRELYKGWTMEAKRSYTSKTIPRTECLWIKPGTQQKQLF